jgi:hypothetical protein
MGLLRVESLISWPTAQATQTASVNATYYPSEEYVFSDADVGCSVQVRADNSGTPSAGDVLNVYIAWSNGDLESGGGSNDYDTDLAAQFLMQLDTFTGSPLNGIVIKTLPIDPMGGKAFKLLVNAPAGATHSIVVSARKLVTKAS